MTTLKAVERQYPALAPDERFRLAVAALVRDDRGDLARLVDTCPRQVFSLTELAYRGRIEALHHVLDLAAVTIADLVRGIMVGEALAMMAVALRDGIREGYALGYAHGWRACWAWHGSGGDAPEHADKLGYTLDQLTPELDAGAEEQVPEFRRLAFDPARAAAFCRAFDEWAQEATGADGRELVGVFHGARLVERATRVWSAVEGIDPDPAELADWRRELAELWAAGLADL